MKSKLGLLALGLILGSIDLNCSDTQGYEERTFFKNPEITGLDPELCEKILELRLLFNKRTASQRLDLDGCLFSNDKPIYQIADPELRAMSNTVMMFEIIQRQKFHPIFTGLHRCDSVNRESSTPRDLIASPTSESNPGAWPPGSRETQPRDWPPGS